MGDRDLRVLPVQVVAHGRTACQLADYLRSVRSAWASATDRPGDACGYRESCAAFGAMQDAWFDELGVYIQVLEELCAAIQDAGNGYQSVDRSAAGGLRAAL